MAGLQNLVTEDGVVAQKLLKSNLNDELYDTIVIGSGMGGGVVASALADENKRVLVLEAGSLLFPTHVGNLPRRLMIGKFQKHIWSLWYNFSVQNYNNDAGSVYRGAQGFNLGGRSIFWGSSIPRLAEWELDVWPKEIRQYLLDESDQGGYALADGVFNRDTPELQPFHAKAVGVLESVLGTDWIVGPAPVAVEYSGATEWSVPSGIFSTADLLLEDALATDEEAQLQGRKPLTVNLNHAVHRVVFDQNNNKRAVGVQCYDLLNKVERTYRAKSVVLSAGTLESPKIALQSGIQNNLIGQGIVDHPIYYRHFVIPPAALEALNMNKPADVQVNKNRFEAQSTKIIVRHKSAKIDNHAFDIIIELGAQFNQGRFVDKDHLRNEIKERNDYLICEIVFQFYAPLMEGNRVQLGGNDPATRLRVFMQEATIQPELLTEAREIAQKIFQKFQADRLLDEDALYANDGLPNLKLADVGGVAHEVGTLRMPVNGQAGVVDADLKFAGYENLFACDNSVFPCSPAGNPSLTLVALARRCAKTVAKIV